MSRFIVCDIGGTNSRFAIFSVDDTDTLKKEQELWLKTKEHESFTHLLHQVKKTHGDFRSGNFNKAIVSVPGPVTTENILYFPNVEWPINKSSLRKSFKETKVFFLNDFIAQAYGCLALNDAYLMPIVEGADTRKTCNDIAIVGAGTGLGHATLKFTQGNNYIAIASEAGHAAFPFISEEERKVSEFIINKTGCDYPSYNNVVSGVGLSALHHFITGKDISPAEVAGEITVTSETTKLFSRFYGRSCRNYVLSNLAGGGKLVVSGGVAMKNTFLINNNSFKDEFINCEAMKHLLTSIPVYLNTNESIGLWGGAYYAQFHAGN